MVRDLSSKVVLSFVGGENLFDLLVSMAMLLPEERARLSANRTHGLLLQLLKLHVAAVHWSLFLLLIINYSLFIIHY